MKKIHKIKPGQVWKISKFSPISSRYILVLGLFERGDDLKFILYYDITKKLIRDRVVNREDNRGFELVVDIE